MEQSRGDGQFELPGIDVRFDPGGMAPFEQQGKTDGRLQRMLQIMIAQIDRGVIGMAAAK